MASTALGLKILELRKAKKLTQTELGKLIGISGVAVSQFEKGANKPSYDTIVKLSDVLDFDFNSLYIESYATKELATSYTVPSAKDYTGPEEVYIGNKFIGKPVINLPSFIKYCLLNDPFPLSPTSFPSDSVVGHRFPYLEGLPYNDSVVLEIQGNSMAPRYPNESWHLVRRIEHEQWQYATGVHAIWLKSQKLFIRRIISNKEGLLVLSADATGEQSTVKLEDVSSLWKFGQAVHLPPED